MDDNTLSLGELIYTVLGCLSLFLVFQTISPYFSTPTNQDIAQHSAQELVQFVDFSEKNKQGLDECYSLLKLKNLESFQFKEEDEKSSKKNFIFIITGKSVSIYPYLYAEKIRADGLKALEGVKAIKSFPFEREVRLYEDETSTAERYFWITWVSQDEVIELSSETLDAIMLEPKFSKQLESTIIGRVEAKDTFNFLEGQNTYNVYFLDAQDSEYFGESDYLVLRQSTRGSQLFFPENRLSLRYAQEGLCSLNALRKENNGDLKEGVDLA